jgi:hypothetical protein
LFILRTFRFDLGGTPAEPPSTPPLSRANVWRRDETSVRDA